MHAKAKRRKEMIKKWVKILPYWLVVRFCRNFSGNYGKLIVGKEYDITYFQIDEGEFVVFSKGIQDVFDKRRDKKRTEKTNRKLEKINKQLSQDHYLKEKLEEQFKEDKEQEFED